MKKTKTLFLHAQRRLGERYGLHLTKQKQEAICNKIRSGDSVFVFKQSNRVAIHDVEYHGVLLRVVYDKERHQIVTFLFPHEQKNNHYEQDAS